MCCRICLPRTMRQRGTIAQHFDAHGVLAINLMSSPGAGKTALLEATIVALRESLPYCGHRGRSRNRQRRRPHSRPRRSRRCRSRPAPPVTSMRTWCIGRCTICRSGGSICCSSKTSAISCVRPAFDLGQHRNVTLLCVTEGDDKPAKYPGHVSRQRSGRAQQDRSARGSGGLRSGSAPRPHCAHSAAIHR